MFSFVQSNWPIIVSIATVSAAVFSHFKSYMEIKQIRIQLKMSKMQIELLEEQLRRLKSDDSIEYSTVNANRIIKPTERQITRFGRTSSISLLLIISVSTLLIFLHYKLQNTQEILQMAVPLSKQGSEFQRTFLDKLTLLSTLKDQTDSLTSRLSSTEKEYRDVIDNHFASVDKNDHLKYEKEIVTHEIANLKSAIKQVEQDIERLNEADSILVLANSNLTKCIEDVKRRNEHLEEIKRDLEQKLDIPIIPWVALLEPQLIVSVPAGVNLLEYRVHQQASASHVEWADSLLQVDFHAEIDYIALMKKIGIMSIVEANIKITEDFNKRLANYLKVLEREIKSKSNAIRRITENNEALEKEIEELNDEKRALEWNYGKLEKIFSTAEKSYKDATEEHKKLIRDYSREHNRQLKLLEEIGELRLALERDKS
jgi:DNA repair exonuclease SbcCD ATPase subunit